MDRPGWPAPAVCKVLLIDDNGQLVEALQDGLRLLGHEVHSSRKGSDTQRLVDLLNPDVVVADLILPDFDTLAAIDELRRTKPKLKIIAISGNQHLLSVAIQRGVNHALVKPFDLKRLDKAIKAVAR